MLPSLVEPLIRTSTLAVAASVVSLCLGWMIAVRWHLGRPPSAYWLLPILAGSAVGGFAAKAAFFSAEVVKAALADRAIVFSMLASLAVITWPLIGVVVYVLGARFRSLPEKHILTLKVAGATPREIGRDLLWPSAIPAVRVLIFLSCALASTQAIGIDLLLHASPGTHTDLTAHAMARLYRAAVPLNPVAAADRTVAIGLGITLVTLLSGAALALLLPRFIRGFVVSLSARRPSHRGEYSISGRFILGVYLAPLVAPPLVFGLGELPEIRGFATAVGLAVLGGLVVAGIAVLLAEFLSLAQMSGSGGQKFPALVISLLFAPYFVPPISLLLLQLKAIRGFGFSLRTPGVPEVAWGLGQLVWVGPILVIFAIVFHVQQVPDGEVALTRFQGARIKEILRDSFWTRFSVHYAVLGLFSFGMVWAEAGYTSLLVGLGRSIPSTAVDFLLAASGRAASYGTASSLSALFLVPLVGGIAILEHYVRLFDR